MKAGEEANRERVHCQHSFLDMFCLKCLSNPRGLHCGQLDIPAGLISEDHTELDIEGIFHSFSCYVLSLEL